MYDAIVVGARCAGSPTAMLLASKRLQSPAPGQSWFSERHALDPLHPPTGGRPTQEVGAVGQGGGLELSTGSPPEIRRWSIRPGRHAAIRRRGRGWICTTAARA